MTDNSENKLEFVLNIELVEQTQVTIDSLLASDCSKELIKQLFLTFFKPRISNSLYLL